MSAAADGREAVVEIVIDNYNYARYLPAAIDSALAQTHPRVRVIVVDDGSTDDSAAVIERYGDRVEAVLKENGGQASAFNAGFERCRGDVVIFLDADDVLAPQAAARAAAAFAADPRLVKVQSRMAFLDAAGRPTGVVKPAPHLPLPRGDMRAAELAYPFDLTWMATSGNAFRAAALREIFPIPPEPYRICADWYLVHLSALLGEVASLDEVNAFHRLHGENNYEPQEARLDLDQVRATIGYARATSAALLELAGRLGLPRPDRILSLADLANRMISLRLEPGAHPLPGDRPAGLLRDAVAAARRRDNATAPMKALFLAWFAAMAVAPRGAARRLAVAFLFPERRRGVNSILGRFQRGGAREVRQAE